MSKRLYYLGLGLIAMMLLVVSCQDDEEIYDKLRISETTVRMMKDETVQVKITGGSGQFEAYSKDKSKVTTTLTDRMLTVKGVAEGETNVEVKDLKTDEVIIIEVGVDVDPNKLQLESSRVTVKEGETIKVPILNGNGNYELEIDYGRSNLDASLEGNEIIITGKYETKGAMSAGRIKIKDILINKSIMVRVTVVGKDETPAAPAEEVYTTFQINTKAFENKTEIRLKLNADEADKAGVWVDINNNGKKDEGETVTEFCNDFSDDSCGVFSFEPKSKVVRVYGKVKDFCYGGRSYWDKGYARSFDVTHNAYLQKVILKGDYLKELDFSTAKNLKYLKVKGHLTTLKVKGCTNLEELICRENEIKNLDCSGLISLKKLDCQDNSQFMETLNIKGCTNLEELNVEGCSGLKNLDVSDCSKLKILNLTSIKLDTPLNDFTALTALIELNCSDTEIATLNVSNNKELKILDCSYNSSITNLDLSKNTKLEELDCRYTRISNLDVTPCKNLTKLICEDVKLSSLDLSQNTALTELNAEKNELTSLDVSNCTKLEKCRVESNQLTSLNVSQNTELTNLNCNKNKLTSLDIRNCTNLESLECNSNQLTSLDVSNCSVLEELYCNNNKLTKLNVANGANEDMYTMEAKNNPNLKCIQHDEDFTPEDWEKDDTANWSTTPCDE